MKRQGKQGVPLARRGLSVSRRGNGKGRPRKTRGSLHGAAQESGDVVLLEEHVEEHAGNDRDGDSCLQQAPVGAADRRLLTRGREYEGQRESRTTVHDDEGSEKLVP